MYKYVGDISEISHFIIKSYSREFNIAVDGTMGNGHDTDFLAINFNRVYAFEIQEAPVDVYRNKNVENVTVIHDSHDKLQDYIDEKVDCIVYNLGFLPGGDKSVTTSTKGTIESVNQGLKLLKPGGIMCVSAYAGHEEGKLEYDALIEFTSKLKKNKFGVMHHEFLNRDKASPKLIVIEKNMI